MKHYSVQQETYQRATCFGLYGPSSGYTYKTWKKLKKNKYYIFIGDIRGIYIFTYFSSFYVEPDDGQLRAKHVAHW
jgi:hypothetical protein